MLPGALIQPLGTEEFAVWVTLNGLGIPAFVGYGELKQAIIDDIRAWKWKLTARTVARIIGSQAEQTFGGPDVIAGVLAVSACNCRDVR